MSDITGIRAVAPSTVGVGEAFDLQLKVLTAPYVVDWQAGWNRPTPYLTSRFNRSPRAGYHFMDNTPVDWSGTLMIDGAAGPLAVDFSEGRGPNGPHDRRPIRRVSGFRIASPGVHYLTISDPESGLETTSNAIIVAEQPGPERLYWGDLHAHTIFTDAIRAPEELCAFARDEGFLDFFALSDHSEALTEWQWRYFQDVLNGFHDPPRFVTLIGQEWTNHVPELGAPGHRNIYYRGEQGPILRCTDPAYDSLEKVYAVAREHGALVVPHHSANTVMGVKWEAGHDPTHERLVEIHSVWGNSERPADAGNPYPILNCDGETHGRHVQDALNMNRRFGIIGSGDIHDGRPGDCLARFGPAPQHPNCREQGLVGLWTRKLSRDGVFEALWQRRTFATTNNRTILRFSLGAAPMGGSVAPAAELPLMIRVHSDAPVSRLDLVRNAEDILTIEPHKRDVRVDQPLAAETPGWYMLRVTRADGGMAWSSPVWVDDDPDLR